MTSVCQHVLGQVGLPRPVHWLTPPHVSHMKIKESCLMPFPRTKQGSLQEVFLLTNSFVLRAKKALNTIFLKSFGMIVLYSTLSVAFIPFLFVDQEALQETIVQTKTKSVVKISLGESGNPFQTSYKCKL